ncbi:enolase C-terminal domain-like protein [Catellatospora citrea]|uniref:L-fuconate dehydratase n=1 Tax=Catellatospora citrea TaxID=53366 RepID=A0A8J3KPS4_9ACTN|nr:enolase C-terminal domain-like protein [Catellatospora citrea]RKE10381.1 L-fuconate dehydratase [Catellatospora citrea]GIF99114.1 mandelate racemase [Catellatospora citrea]
MKLIDLRVRDIRFPTSRHLDGSDAMNPDPDYSAAYVELITDGDAVGHGFTFTIGRGNDICAAAIEALRPYVVGQDLDTLDLGEFGRRLTHDSQLRWLGPEKGVMHLAAGAVINAAWDLASRRAGLPLWRYLTSLSPDVIVDCVDWRYLTDALTPAAARDLLAEREPGRAARAEQIAATGFPAYTTSAGWLGYDDAKVTRRALRAVADGFSMVKLKVGADLNDDLRRFTAAREALGPDFPIGIDANQRWGVGEAIDWVSALGHLNPYWIEEPTSPDEILGHAAIRVGLSRAGRDGTPIRVATGEHVHNRIMFKQLLQADAVDVVQLDSARVAGVNENLAILLLAAAYDKPVCPHAGGVGLCELVQHLSFFDYTSVAASLDGRMIEYVDHLHEHFADPVRIVNGRYAAPEAPGFSARMHEESLVRYSFPDGPEWKEDV